MISDLEYPRVLVVAAAPVGGVSGTGVTLSNLFKNWPVARLAQVHTTEWPSQEIGTLSLRLPDTLAPFDSLGRTLIRRAGSQPSSAPSIAAVPLGAGASRAARTHAGLRAMADLSPLRYPASLRVFVDDFSPEVVYSPLGSARIVRLAGRVARMAAVPLVPHFMDDWPHTLYSSGELCGLAHRQMRRDLRRALAHAKVGLAISQAMAEEYAAEFGFEFRPFANPADVSATIAQQEPARERAVRFVYVGGLHLGRWGQLLEIADALKEFPGPAALTVFAPEAHLRDCPVPEPLRSTLVIGGSWTPDAAVAAMRQADVLVHVESFDEQTLSYTRLSMSTKVSQYLGSGRPILGFGPARQASMAHIRAVGAGIVAESRDELRDAVATLITSESTRIKMGRLGHSWALAKVDAEKVRADFASALRAGSVG